MALNSCSLVCLDFLDLSAEVCMAFLHGSDLGFHTLFFLHGIFIRLLCCCKFSFFFGNGPFCACGILSSSVGRRLLRPQLGTQCLSFFGGLCSLGLCICSSFFSSLQFCKFLLHLNSGGLCLSSL